MRHIKWKWDDAQLVCIPASSTEQVPVSAFQKNLRVGSHVKDSPQQLQTLLEEHFRPSIWGGVSRNPNLSKRFQHGHLEYVSYHFYALGNHRRC